MPDFRFNRLEKYKVGGTSDRMELRIPLPQTPSGKVYRWCPNNDCAPRLFLLGDAQRPDNLDITLLPRAPGTPGTTCPYCRCDADDDGFNYEGDIKAIQDYIEWAASRDIGDYLDKMSTDFNRSLPKGGLISMQMKVDRATSPEPRAWREDLIRNLACDACGRQYGVYAIALFCPDCGSRNLSVHFEREIELIILQLDIAEQVGDAGNRELSYRVLGNAHEDVLTAFETYQKTFYKFMIRTSHPKERADTMVSKAAIGNSFQNIERARGLYRNLSIDPFSVLTSDQLDEMQLYIEKRHVIGHNLSLADEAYSDRDVQDRPGTTVELLADEVATFAELAKAIVAELERCIP